MAGLIPLGIHGRVPTSLSLEVALAIRMVVKVFGGHVGMRATQTPTVDHLALAMSAGMNV